MKQFWKPYYTSMKLNTNYYPHFTDDETKACKKLSVALVQREEQIAAEMWAKACEKPSH